MGRLRACALAGADVRSRGGAQGGPRQEEEEPGSGIPLATEVSQQLAMAASGLSGAIRLGGPFCLLFTILNWYAEGEVHASKPSHLLLCLSDQKDIVALSYCKASTLSSLPFELSLLCHSPVVPSPSPCRPKLGPLQALPLAAPVS